MKGAKTQEITILPMPLSKLQLTAEGPKLSNTAPDIAPITACVQDTVNPNFEAVIVHTELPINEQHIASINKGGLYSNKSLLTIPLMVFVVFEPNNTAPKNSVKHAMMQACISVIDPDPTLVEKLFDTSLLPIP
eukprot:NODE_515_length_6587_cov_0.940197.p6 type:complete len:134 gc:universal NODE_515_length_6587_cov_0.940197:2237-2638(+)